MYDLKEGNFVAGNDTKIAIVASRFNENIVESLLSGAIDSLARHGVDEKNITVVRVSGAWEIGVAALKLAKSKKYSGIIALGCVIKGETPHFDYVAGGCANALNNVSLQQELPVSFGVLTTNTVEQAVARAGGKAGNKGVEAALALLESINVLEKI